MYICDRCGDVVDEIGSDRVWHRELEEAYYTDEEESCTCGGSYVDAALCENCGEYEADDKLTCGWCRGCVADLCEERGLDSKRDIDEVINIIMEASDEKD